MDNRLIRFYNQNRKKIWLYILIFVAAIALLQILNNYAGVVNEKNEDGEGNSANSKTKNEYIKQNYSVTNSETISESANSVLVTVIDTFIYYCNNGNIDGAYSLITNDCKKELYPTKEDFKNKYYKDIFSEERLYSAQLWIKNEGTYTYRIGLTENMLATGEVSFLEIEDYYTLVYENGSYKLNINDFVAKKQINKEAQKGNLKITVLSSTIYMDYVKYTFYVENSTNNTIMLESRESTSKVYIEDENGVKSIAHMYKLLDEEIKLSANSKKEVTIKFERPYKPSIKEIKIVFEDIVVDYDKYLKEKESDRLELSVNL